MDIRVECDRIRDIDTDGRIKQFIMNCKLLNDIYYAPVNRQVIHYINGGTLGDSARDLNSDPAVIKSFIENAVILVQPFIKAYKTPGNTSITDFEMSIRGKRVLLTSGLNTREKVLAYIENGGSLQALKNCGAKTEENILHSLEVHIISNNKHTHIPANHISRYNIPEDIVRVLLSFGYVTMKDIKTANIAKLLDQIGPERFSQLCTSANLHLTI